jgi:dihydroorotase/N-acyl-D-amino-acid deacylase
VGTFSLQGGAVYDGTGRPPFIGNVIVRDGLILDVSAGRAGIGIEGEGEIIDCVGLAIAPGFIDVHSHSDLQALEGRREKLHQGVTTEVAGNCGFSSFPCGHHAPELRSFANGILHGSGNWAFHSAKEYLELGHRADLPNRVETLVGHGTLRVAQVGMSQRPLTEKELDAMLDDLDAALSQGAVGVSTGLMYAPGSGAPREELLALCKVAARHGKLHCTHIRDYGFHLLEAIEEQLSLARESGCRLQISHLQTVGKANRDRNARAVEMIETAHAEGVDVAFDCYPYTCGSTVMTQLLPQSALEGGIDALLARLADPAVRGVIAQRAAETIANTWDEIFVSAVTSEENADCVGKSVEEIAEARSIKPMEAVFQLIREERGAVNILQQNQSEENLQVNLAHPLAIVISDGFYVKGRPHPRLYGTFPEFLARSQRDPAWLPLETAIHKITGAPARRFGIAQRGELRPGYAADITVFDPKRIASRASYANPEQRPEGIVQVFRDGLNRMDGIDRQAAPL